MGSWKMSASSTPTWETCRQRWHSTVNKPRVANGLPTTTSGTSLAADRSEKSARVPGGTASVEGPSSGEPRPRLVATGGAP
jgi:hypothetical protein